jgi:hypothetical protein
MALAGEHEVFVPIQPQFHRATELVRGHRGPYRDMARLGFLATKPTAHAPAFHPDGMVVDTQSVRDPVLNLTGVLAAAVDQPLVLLLRQGVSYLTFEVKVLLPTNFQ